MTRTESEEAVAKRTTAVTDVMEMIVAMKKSETCLLVNDDPARLPAMKSCVSVTSRVIDIVIRTVALALRLRALRSRPGVRRLTALRTGSLIV
jgi:hypothetical protein